MGDVKPVREYMDAKTFVDDPENPGEKKEVDAPQPVEVASRVIAHLGYRVPGFQKLNKRFSGKDRTSGILSDLGILIGQVAARNEELLEEVGANIFSGAMAGKGNAGQPREASPEQRHTPVMEEAVRH